MTPAWPTGTANGFPKLILPNLGTVTTPAVANIFRQLILWSNNLVQQTPTANQVLTATGPTGLAWGTSSGGAVSKIIPGRDITVSPGTGTGTVTVNVQHPIPYITWPWTSPPVATTSYTWNTLTTHNNSIIVCLGIQIVTVTVATPKRLVTGAFMSLVGHGVIDRTSIDLQLKTGSPGFFKTPTTPASLVTIGLKGTIPNGSSWTYSITTGATTTPPNHSVHSNFAYKVI